MIRSLELENFRSFEKKKIEFDSKINIISGNNAAGKTTILEAIYFIANASSFKTTNSFSLIKKGASEFKIIANYKDDVYFNLVNNNKKRIFKNKVEIKKIREHIGSLNVNCFYPEFIYIFKSQPKKRRDLLNREISKKNKDYLYDLLKYNKLLKNRNIVLKSNDKYREKLIDSIDKKIIPLQARIIKKRIDFINMLNKEIKLNSDDFFQKRDLFISYESFVNGEEKNIEKEIKAKIEESKKIDFETKTTQKGIHKEDWKMILEDKNIEFFSSQGEQRIAAIILILSFLKLNKESKILLLDDIYFELSKENREKITKIITNFDQVFITTCDLKMIPTEKIFEKYKIIDLKEREEKL